MFEALNHFTQLISGYAGKNKRKSLTVYKKLDCLQIRIIEALYKFSKINVLRLSGKKIK